MSVQEPSQGSSGLPAGADDGPPGTGTPGRPRRSGRGLLLTGIALLVVGVLTAVGAGIGLLSSGSGLVDAFRADPVQVPGEVQLSLTPATYTVLQLSDGQSYKIALDEIDVTGPGGTVPVSEPGVTETLDRNGKVYESIAQFRVSQAGGYTVAVASQGSAEIIISQSIGTTITRSAVWFALLGLAGLLTLVGLGLLIFGIVRTSMRSAAQPQQVSAAGPAMQAPLHGPPTQPVPPVRAPAGWYPDPERAGQQRYWDGDAWTEHRA